MAYSPDQLASGDLPSDSLTVADKITSLAPSLGADPYHALCVGNAESSLSLNPPDSPTGAVGPMQILPSTWEGLRQRGLVPPNANIRNPDDNIHGGVALLGDLYGRYRNTADATVAYMVGEPAAATYFKTHDLADIPDKHRDELANYLSTVDSCHPLTGKEKWPAEQAAAISAGGTPAPAAVAPAPAPDTSPAVPGYVRDRNQLLGAIGGGALAGGEDLLGATLKTPERIGRAIGEGLRGAAPAAVPPSTPNQQTRIMQGGEGDTLGTTGRARQEGYNAKTAGEALQRRWLAGDPTLTPAEIQLARNLPNMGSTQSGILANRGTLSADPLASVDKATVQAAKANLKSGLQSAPGWLDSAKGALSGLAAVARNPVVKVLRDVGLGGLGGYSVMGSLADAANRRKAGDTFGAGLSSTEAAANAAMMIPKLSIPGAVVSGGLSALDFARQHPAPDNFDWSAASP